MQKQHVILLCIILSIAVFTMTYGRWEYLSFGHQDEFVDTINRSFAEGCILGESPQTIKVMNYNDDHASVWVKGKSQSTYLIRFHKNGNSRSLRNTGNNNQVFCDIEIIHSTLGGGADELYWYW